MTPADTLRVRLDSPGIIVAPGVSDGLSAQMAAEAGFDVLYMTGAGVSLGTFGTPDVGLLTLTEMAAACARITSAVGAPLIADADTGYGNALNMTRTVEEFIRAGAAAIQIEDQETPKKCGHLEGKRVVSAEEMALKIEAACAARGDSELLIVARTDARQSLGMDAALERCRLYREAGADILFLEAPQGEEEIARVGEPARGVRLQDCHLPGRGPARERLRHAGGLRSLAGTGRGGIHRGPAPRFRRALPHRGIQGDSNNREKIPARGLEYSLEIFGKIFRIVIVGSLVPPVNGALVNFSPRRDGPYISPVQPFF